MKFFGKGLYGWLAILVSIVIAIVLLITSITDATSLVTTEAAEPEATTNVTTPPPEPTPEPTPEPAEESEPIQEPESPWHFYNRDLQDDDDPDNDFNFGPNPIPEVIAEAGFANELAQGASLDEIMKKIDPKLFDKNLRYRMVEDPALGAADMAWHDALTGTRYLGVFYDECESKWDAAINKAKEDWIGCSADYSETLEFFFEFLSKAEKVELRYVDKKLDDQMYMNPETVDYIPDVIVMETDEHTGWYLVYVYKIKDKKVEVMYRIDCGYQPTNVAKVMKITPVN
ncbi:MAG: hypothetical protein Q4F58_01375, partial [Candidatus Saccharibacteria bacterium]|nr:hypothetical protein [Candidatus Saccharibacteria bacterium]